MKKVIGFFGAVVASSMLVSANIISVSEVYDFGCEDQYDMCDEAYPDGYDDYDEFDACMYGGGC